MKLAQFSVTNFRSIQRAEKLRLGDFTVLVGPNNEGKSNLLEALAIGMQGLSIRMPRIPRPQERKRFRVNVQGAEQFEYHWERDFPQTLQGNDNGRTTLSFDFELTTEEVDEFQEEVGSRFNEILPISLSFGRSSRPSFKVRKQGPSQRTLLEKKDEIARFVADRVQLQYVPAVRTGERVSEIVQRMLGRELARTAEEGEIAEALEAIKKLQEPIFESLSTAIAERLKRFLPEVSSVTIQADENPAMARALARGVGVVIDDGVPTDLSFKGDGVQSLAALAMIQHYSKETARAREFILAVEEPEAHLHPKAIHALRDTLKETAASQQVIATTHSPLLVNRLNLASNIIVTKNHAIPARSVQELRDVLGVHVTDNLVAAEVVLIVEGPTDSTALHSLLASNEKLRPVLEDGLLSLMPLHGSGNINYLLTQVQDSLAATHAFLDNDDAGKAAASASEDAGLLTPADITMAMRRGERGGCELEDLIDPAIYEAPFLEQLGVSIDHPWMNRMSEGKWSKRMKVVFQASGKSWSTATERKAKALVASSVVESPETAVIADCRGVIESVERCLEQKLEKRSG